AWPGGCISGRPRRADAHQGPHEGWPRTVNPQRAGEREPEESDDLRRGRRQVQDQRGVRKVALGENRVDHQAGRLARARAHARSTQRRAGVMTPATTSSAAPNDNVMPAPPNPTRAVTLTAGVNTQNGSRGCLTYTPCHRDAIARRSISRNERRYSS